jgi:hypothetical protein
MVLANPGREGLLKKNQQLRSKSCLKWGSTECGAAQNSIAAQSGNLFVPLIGTCLSSLFLLAWFIPFSSRKVENDNGKLSRHWKTLPTWIRKRSHTLLPGTIDLLHHKENYRWGSGGSQARPETVSWWELILLLESSTERGSAQNSNAAREFRWRLW